MRIKTVEEAKALVGTIWERDGLKREITRVERLREMKSYNIIAGDVYWRRPGGKERKLPQWIPYFNEWLTKAKRIK